MNTYENENDDSGLDFTVLDRANIELLDDGESYRSENDTFTVRRLSEDEKSESENIANFSLSFESDTHYFLDIESLIEYCEGE